MHRKFCFVGIILLPLIATDLRAAQDLRIMVVISNNAHVIWGGNDLFNDVKDGIINVMEQANLPIPSFHKYATYPQLVESALTPNAAMNISLSPTYLTARNNATADIVLFVLSDINAPDSQDCGGARGIPARKIDLVADLISTHHIQNANYRFVAYITTNHPGCLGLAIEYQAAHEIGHVLFAEHQVVLQNGVATGEVTSNNDVNLPHKENHPAVNGSNRTMMYSTGPSGGGRFYSKQGAKFLNGQNAYGTYSKVANYMASTSYDYVAHYRMPAPPSVACGDYFLGCPVGCGHSPYMLTWSSPTATSYQVQHKLFGSWVSYYTGSGLSTLASTGTIFSEQFRVRGVNDAGPGNWCTIWIEVQCSETQDPW